MTTSAESPQETAPLEDGMIGVLVEQGFFHPSTPIWVARAPGRLDLMGGNVDYTGGLVLQSLLRESIWVAVQPRPDDVIRIFNPGAAKFGWETRLSVVADDLDDVENLRLYCEQNEHSRWGTYVLGALHFLKKSYGSSKGANLFISFDLPPNKGVSSSAALEVAVLKAASAAQGVRLEGIALATAAQWVENVVVGAACGVMDQAAIVLGQENRLLPLLCQPCQPLAPIVLPAGVRVWGIDSMVSRSTTGDAYKAARAAAFIGYKLICQREGIDITCEDASAIPRFTDSRWNGYLSNLTPSEFRSRYERWLPESLTGHDFIVLAGEHVDPFTQISPATEYPVRAAVRYAVEENLRVQTVHALLESSESNPSPGVLRLLGEILCQCHVAYAGCGLGSDDCDELVARALKAGLPGAKMTGGGAGGVVAILGVAGDDRAIQALAQEYAAGRDRMPHIFEGSSRGVDAFGVQVLQPSSLQGIR